MARRTMGWFVVLAAVGLLAGCASSVTGTPAAESVTLTLAAPTARSTTPTPTARSTTPLLPSTGRPPATTIAAPRSDSFTGTRVNPLQYGSGSIAFTSPSGNFTCGVNSAQEDTPADAGCQGATSPVPPRPASCPAGGPAWGYGMAVDATGQVTFLCEGGVRYGAEGPPGKLSYGSIVSHLGFTCASHEDGMYCRDDTSGHGFRIASDSNAAF